MEHKKKDFTILIIDDDLDDHFFIKEAISQVGLPIQVMSAFDGTQGLECLERIESGSQGQRVPDLILCDINMPIMGGLSFLETVKNNANYRNVPVCMLTTSCDLPTKDKLLSLGALDCVIKPQYAKNYNTILANIFNMVASFEDL